MKLCKAQRWSKNVLTFQSLSLSSIHPRNFGNHVTVRPSARTTGQPMWNVILSSQCGSLQPVFHLIIDIHIVVNWQLSTQGICWTVSRECIGARMATHRGHVFFGNFPLTSCWLLIVGRLKFMFLSHMVIDLGICLQWFKSPLSEVNPKSINGSFAFNSG